MFCVAVVDLDVTHNDSARPGCAIPPQRRSSARSCCSAEGAAGAETVQKAGHGQAADGGAVRAFQTFRGHVRAGMIERQ